MTDTERSPETTARLRAEILREAARTAKVRLAAREEQLARLQTQVARLKASLNPKPAATPPSGETAKFVAPPLPQTANWTSFAPYAAIVAFAVCLELGGPHRPASVEPNLNALIRPAPAVVANARTAAQGAPIVADDDRSQEALLLVREWTLPGDTKPLGERLGGELDLPGGRPFWNVERTGAHDYRVTFQPAEKDLPYAFEADIEARVVWPTPETQELLAPRVAAALRGSAR